MHWRYRLRKQQLLDECEVAPEVFQGGLERLAEFARPFADVPGPPGAAGPCPDLPRRARLRPEAEDRRVDRLPPRPGAARPPALRRLLDLGPPAAAARAGRPGGPRDRHPRRGDRLRPLGVRQEGRRLGGRAAAVARAAREGRQRPGRRLHGLRLAPRARPGRRPALPAQGVGQGPRAAEAVRHPQGGAVPDAARAGAGDARGDRAAAAARLGHRRRRDGPLVAVPGRVASLERALPAGGAVEHDGPRPGGRGARSGAAGGRTRSGRSSRSGPGPSRCRRGRGGGSRWATASAGRSSWSWSRRGWWRGRTGGGSGRRSCWW